MCVQDRRLARQMRHEKANATLNGSGGQLFNADGMRVRIIVTILNSQTTSTGADAASASITIYADGIAIGAASNQTPYCVIEKEKVGPLICGLITYSSVGVVVSPTAHVVSVSDTESMKEVENDHTG